MNLVLVCIVILAAVVRNVWLICHTTTSLKKNARRVFIRSLITALLFLIPNGLFVVVLYSQFDKLLADAKRATLLEEGKSEWLVTLAVSAAAATPILTLVPLLFQKRNLFFMQRVLSRVTADSSDSAGGTL